ncbi:T4 RnlA family RNA ligase [Saccharopolyspora indica]|uniref:RNA ligase n=1 Tax=Saccharopolyspora indica TaxID=1229659 RepID=UPI0022EA146E|nr:RNA ligase [Saccharopolyspora indica]MDA3643828.1 RNA ligase [Saccharopolyspora indica]
MKLHELLDMTELNEMIEQKFIRVQRHPDYPLSIYNYTDKAVIFHVWNKVTKTCRGLIVDDEGTIVARPFPKFFNYGEAESKTYKEYERVTVSDKLDGSLGILYPTPDGQWAIATRGSFTSDQALHATAVLQEKYSDALFQESETWLFEIIYPENRIVVDYDGLDDLVLIGAVHKESGLIYPARYFEKEDWSGPQAEEFEYSTLEEALAAPSRPGREGLVVLFYETQTMLKLKQADYLRLHKIVTGLNEHVVWEHIQNAWLVRDLLECLPDEFHGWVLRVADDLFGKWYDLNDEIQDRFSELVSHGLTEGPRKDFALAVKDLPPVVKASLFKLLDGQNPQALIWKAIEPKKNTFVH